jgi:hypothetical protein
VGGRQTRRQGEIGEDWAAVSFWQSVIGMAQM